MKGVPEELIWEVLAGNIKRGSVVHSGHQQPLVEFSNSVLP